MIHRMKEKKVVRKLVAVGILIVLVLATAVVALATNKHYIKGVVGQSYAAKDGYVYTFDHPNGTTIGMESYGIEDRAWDGTYEVREDDLFTQAPR